MQESLLGWVLVRPSLLNDNASQASVRALTDIPEFHGGNIATSDVASFVLDQVRNGAWLHQAPLIFW